MANTSTGTGLELRPTVKKDGILELLLSTAKASGPADNPVVTATISPAVMKSMAGRLEQSLPVRHEGAGAVAQAGASPAAQALMWQTVTILGGVMYSQYR